MSEHTRTSMSRSTHPPKPTAPPPPKPNSKNGAVASANVGAHMSTPKPEAAKETPKPPRQFTPNLWGPDTKLAKMSVVEENLADESLQKEGSSIRDNKKRLAIYIAMVLIVVLAVVGVVVFGISTLI